MSPNEIFAAARNAAEQINLMSTVQKKAVLEAVADAVEADADLILQANQSDCSKITKKDPHYRLLLLTPERLAESIAEIRTIADMPSPFMPAAAPSVRPNGMKVQRVAMPFGVIGVIFESRPSVAFKAFAMCFKAGSACVLKGGHDAVATVEAAVAAIRKGLAAAAAPEASVSLLSQDRADTLALLQASDMVDLIIPRGSHRLIDYVRANSKVPFIETGAGVCHTYFHSSGDIATGRDVIYNAKTRRISASNSLDCLLIDRSRLQDLPAICYHLSDNDITIYADEEAYAALDGAYPLLEHATEEDYGREWLDAKLTVRTVEGMDEALQHIRRYGLRHSECIIAENSEAVETFLRAVDAACVYANVSTAFTEAAQFGLGSEIGISTQKLHVRGPVTLGDLVTYKYVITGVGQTRK